MSELKLLVFVLNKEELLSDVMSAFVEIGVGATILDSEGLFRTMVDEVPLFAEFRELMKGSKPYNRTIFSVIRSQEKLDEIVKVIHDICGDLSEPNTGILFTIPVDRVIGLTER